MKQLNLKLHEATINNMRAIALASGYVIQKSDRKGEGSIAAWLNDIYGSKTLDTQIMESKKCQSN